MKLAKKKGAIDYPNERRINKIPITRLGGIAVITGFLISVIYLIVSMVLEGKFSLIDSQKYGMKRASCVGIIRTGKKGKGNTADSQPA